jgi:hypothetical protein
VVKIEQHCRPAKVNCLSKNPQEQRKEMNKSNILHKQNLIKTSLFLLSFVQGKLINYHAADHKNVHMDWSGRS